MSNIIAISAVIISLIIGLLGGIVISIFKARSMERKIMNEAIDFLNNKRDNKITIDGVDYPAKKFIVEGEDGKDKIIDYSKNGK